MYIAFERLAIDIIKEQQLNFMWFFSLVETLTPICVFIFDPHSREQRYGNKLFDTISTYCSQRKELNGKTATN